MVYIECLWHNEGLEKETMSKRKEIYVCNLYAEQTEADHAATTYKYLRNPPLQSFYVLLIMLRWELWTLFLRDTTQQLVDGGGSPAWWGPARIPASPLFGTPPSALGAASGGSQMRGSQIRSLQVEFFRLI